MNSGISILKVNAFVEETGRRRLRVATMEMDHFQSINEYRSVMEPFAVRLAGQQVKGAARDQVLRVLQQGHRALEAGHASDLLNADVAFHEMIYGRSGNLVIENAMRLNWQYVRRSMAEVLRNSSLAISSWRDHEERVTALCDGHVEAAAMMEDHIIRARDKVLATLTYPLPTVRNLAP